MHENSGWLIFCCKAKLVLTLGGVWIPCGKQQESYTNALINSFKWERWCWVFMLANCRCRRTFDEHIVVFSFVSLTWNYVYVFSRICVDGSWILMDNVAAWVLPFMVIWIGGWVAVSGKLEKGSRRNLYDVLWANGKIFIWWMRLMLDICDVNNFILKFWSVFASFFSFLLT